MSIIQELKRRNVIRVGIAYVLLAWVVLQIVDFVLEVIAAPDWILQVFVLAGKLISQAKGHQVITAGGAHAAVTTG